MKNKNYFAVLSMIALAVSIGSIARAETDVVATSTIEIAASPVVKTDTGLSTGTKVKAEKETYRTEAEAKRIQLKAEMQVNQDKIQKEREESRLEIQDKKAELKTQLEKKRNNQLEQIKMRAVKKITAAIARLKNMQTRLESRIAKLDIAKVDTVSAKASLALSKQKLADAKVAIEAVKTITVTADMKTSEKVAKVKEAAKKVEVLLKESHQALVEAIASLKANKDAMRMEAKTDTTAEIKTN